MSDDSRMIEHVAKAMFANNLEASSRRGWDNCDEFTKKIYLDDARAAVDAMRPYFMGVRT